METLKITDREPNTSGAFCSFFTFESYGIKTYSRLAIAKLCYSRQLLASEVGCAPKVLSELMVIRYNKRTLYGFKTELASVAAKHLSCDRYERVEREIQRHMKRLFKVEHYDLHTTNVAKLGNKWVCIDYFPMNKSDDRLRGGK